MVVGCFGASLEAPEGTTWVGASLRSRGAICLASLYGTLAGTAGANQHEPAWEPLRQCLCRELHENTEAGRSKPQRVWQLGRSARTYRAVCAGDLQWPAFAFGVELSVAATV